MHDARRRRSYSHLVAALVLFLVLWTGPAFAYHTEEDRQTDYSAFTLQQNQFRLGLFQLDYGIWDSFMVGTYTAPWVAWIFLGGPTGDVYAKWKFLEVGKFSLAAQGTFFYWDVDDADFGDFTDEGAFRAIVVPFELTGSYVFDDTWTLNAQGIWVQTWIDADATAGESQAFGAAAQNNLQFTVSAEYRLTRVTAFNLLGRWAPFVSDAHISSDATVDEATTANLQGTIDAEDLRNSFLFQGGVTFSWQWLNIKLNCGYGDLFLPGMHIIAPKKTIVPDVDIYARF